jgi:hypothetical protein
MHVPWPFTSCFGEQRVEVGGGLNFGSMHRLQFCAVTDETSSLIIFFKRIIGVKSIACLIHAGNIHIGLQWAGSGP